MAEHDGPLPTAQEDAVRTILRQKLALRGGEEEKQSMVYVVEQVIDSTGDGRRTLYRVR